MGKTKFSKNYISMMDRKKRFCPFCSYKLIRLFIEKRDRLFCSKCDVPIYENPTPAACVVLINNSNEVLLVKRKIEPRKGEWCLPGGFIEIGETSKQAAERELEEETGLIGKIEKLIGVSSGSKDMNHSIIVVSYLVRLFQGVLKPGDDASEVSFFAGTDMPKLAFKSHEKFIVKSCL